MLASLILESVPPSMQMIRVFAAEALGGDLTLQQFRALKFLGQGLGQSQVAEMLFISVAATSKICDVLVQKKLIIKKAGSDRRSYDIKLTPKGKQTLKVIKKHVETKLEFGIQQLTTREKDELFKGLLVFDSLMKKMKEV
jgi:DNA-binding MarR family transcriptional regulator